jgi:hypothetical protein
MQHTLVGAYPFETRIELIAIVDAVDDVVDENSTCAFAVGGSVTSSEPCTHRVPAEIRAGSFWHCSRTTNGLFEASLIHAYSPAA